MVKTLVQLHITWSAGKIGYSEVNFTAGLGNWLGEQDSNLQCAGARRSQSPLGYRYPITQSWSYRGDSNSRGVSPPHYRCGAVAAEPQ